jgi:anti-anti-sigma regulatory factor
VQARRPHHNLDIFHWGVVGLNGLHIIRNENVAANFFHICHLPYKRRNRMLAISPGWELDVERGPDWLIVKIQSMDAGAENPPLAELIWGLMQQHLTHRLVLELDQVPVLNRFLIEQLSQLYRKISEHDGVMRLCGLSYHNRRVLHASRLDERFQPYHDRQEAVLGYSPPSQPR